MKAYVITTYGFTLLFTLTLLVHITRKENRYRGTYRYYVNLVAATALLTFIELISWLFEGLSGSSALFMNYSFNALLYALSALPITMWFIYSDYRIYFSRKVLKKRRYFYLAINLIMFLFVIINIQYPFLFKLNTSNEFVGLGGTLLTMTIQLVYLVVYLISTFIKRNQLSRKFVMNIFIALSLVIVASVIKGATGLPTIWPTMSFLCFFMFLHVERIEMAKDALTGLSLRKQLESRLIQLFKKEQNFSLIMIDLDKFKQINDSFGHVRGDQVLKDFAEILIGAIHKKDSAYRYAGDEFIILIENTNKKTIEKITDRIAIGLDAYHRMHEDLKDLDFSSGLLEFRPSETTTLEEVIAKVDQAMYEDKKQKNNP
ncbi:diguanylate cyclase [Acidaminobacter sp. JC074]|uniref:diguanylate cyclase domain-containing protein n=1 Tax=Acidaminobacter sp. JC074 TaxID=2530199 RepID=UPI001F102105|nr:diguanylate cyclase [Acidaminobacter sp. JC074]MCH4888762.1 diguanylate cyclase [Acidaminobacter sp. JC074]